MAIDSLRSTLNGRFGSEWLILRQVLYYQQPVGRPWRSVEYKEVHLLTTHR